MTDRKQERTYSFNKAGAPPWWAYSTLFGSRHINKPILKIFDKTVWFWRRVDGLIPWPGLSLIVVARKTGAGVAQLPLRCEARPEMSSPNAG